MNVNSHNKTCYMRVCALLLFFAAGESQALKDPATRDEDISGTEINVEYHQRSDGLWEYKYSQTAPDSNKGTVSAFHINLRCDASFDPVSLPHPDPEAEGYDGMNNSKPITPAAIQADWGSASFYAIRASNKASWLIGLRPGESLTYQRLISPAAPGLRKYTLKPRWLLVGWDYSNVQSDPSIPWEDDFFVHGMIAGPGCPGEVPPIEQPRFNGTPNRVGSEELNSLLSYSAPLQDRLHVPAGSSEVAITIHYRDDLNPLSFKVQPGWAKRFFTPVPGTQETVRVPLKHERTRLFLEAHSVKEAPPRTGQQPSAPPAHAPKDRDEFEIRLDGGKG